MPIRPDYRLGAAIAILLTKPPAHFMLLLMKGGALAQQVEMTRSQAIARELVASAFLGGLVTFAIWLLLRPWPSLFTFAVLIGFPALLIGRESLPASLPSSRSSATSR